MKDPKNELWRRVVNGEIEPTQLVKMGPDELSTEMARWRERESQHSLELYKKEAAINITDKDALQLLADAAPLVECRRARFEKKDLGSKIVKGLDGGESDKGVAHSTKAAEEKIKQRELSNLDSGGIPGKEDKMDLRKLDRAQRIIDRVTALERSTSAAWSISPCAPTTSQDAEHDNSNDNNDDNSGVVDTPLELPLSPNAPEISPPLWAGFLRMDPAHFPAIVTHAAGPANTDFQTGLPSSLIICGNIQPAGVNDYLTRLKHANKDIIVIRVRTNSDSAKHRKDLLEIIRMLKARSRLGVVQEMKQTRVKDLYMLPLNPSELPPKWFPYKDELDICSEASLLGLVICHKKGQPSR
ncbi:PHD finger protein 3-like [Tropilaelaps mercedesae]|uniref:PHD finger protein 3-like n=1 Tax=Tropilaelaps mercedesae TaxID=418985 RepID=A0A1V9X774_9ACAR|nr:PHD finger protein 3-like [Tropilaelaps mercedesae]